VLRRSIGAWRLRTLSTVCAALLVAGAVCAAWVAAPWDLVGLAIAHGAAWGLAWAGQLWAPARRGQRGTSPLRAALGYASVPLGCGVVVASAGARGVTDVHAALGVAAAVAWVASELAKAWARQSALRRRAQ